MDYLLKRNNTYYYNRRIPAQFRAYVPRERIRIALGTDSHKAALKLAREQNEKTEKYWQTLVDTGETYSHQHYRAVSSRAQSLGFNYYTAADLAVQRLEQLIERLLQAKKHDLNPYHVEAVLGGVPVPRLMLSEALPRFWALTRDRLLNKSSHQQRKWRNPREKAWRYFVDCIGDKAIQDITRSDMLEFRDWQINRVEAEEIIAASANKDLMNVRSILTVVAENHDIRLDETSLFKKIKLTANDVSKRLPFDHEFLVNTFLNPINLKGMNKQAQGIVFAFAETGAGPSELIGLQAEDIRLDHPIPHIHIVPREKKGLKTKYRERIIPLVGHALDVFREFPNGFTDYWDNPDSASSAIGKYLRENGLKPSDRHSLYSLRHNLQDRLLEAKAPDRVQADLMGHKFKREDYGKGASLELKLEFLEKIKLKP
ncbi:DUF6538 domain-containing protein [Chitinophaga sp. 22536]|uniref:DUF6538 domain-containing protein n=1 Tax=unclassified Chitinophaga TaxID=2619133 RepID=UPI003F8514C8